METVFICSVGINRCEKSSLINMSMTHHFDMLYSDMQYVRFIVIFHILCQQFYLVGAITSKVFLVSHSNLYCMLLMTSTVLGLVQ